MENTTRQEMREIIGVYEQGEAAGAHRGTRAGVVTGVLATLSVVALVVALVSATGQIRLSPSPVEAGTTAAPPLGESGPIGQPAGGIVPLVPGLPPGTGGK